MAALGLRIAQPLFSLDRRSKLSCRTYRQAVSTKTAWAHRTNFRNSIITHTVPSPHATSSLVETSSFVFGLLNLQHGNNCSLRKSIANKHSFSSH